MLNISTTIFNSFHSSSVLHFLHVFPVFWFSRVCFRASPAESADGCAVAHFVATFQTQLVNIETFSKSRFVKAEISLISQIDFSAPHTKHHPQNALTPIIGLNNCKFISRCKKQLNFMPQTCRHSIRRPGEVFVVD